MDQCYNQEMLDEAITLNGILKEKLEMLTNLRVEHARLQLSVAKLYTVECTELLNEYKEVLNNNDEENI